MTLRDAAPESVRRVFAALGGLGTTYLPQPLDRPAGTPAAAAAQIGIPIGAFATSAVFTADDEPLLVIASGSDRIDLLKLSALRGSARLRPATADESQRWTHQPAGQVAPVGHPKPMPTLVDVELSHFDAVWSSAGDAAWVFCTSYAELLRITAGEAAEVGGLVTDAQ